MNEELIKELIRVRDKDVFFVGKTNGILHKLIEDGFVVWVKSRQRYFLTDKGHAALNSDAG